MEKRPQKKIKMIIICFFKEKIDRAENKEVQSIDVNEPFTLDETNPFEYYS